MSQKQSGPIILDYNPDIVPWHFFKDLIRTAAERGQDQPVCQNLVGACLHLTFPEATQDDPAYQAAGQSRPLGHFLIGDTVFLVIMAPLMEVYEKCRENLEQGFRVWLLVTDKYFCGTRQNAEIILPGKINVASIESFVSHSLERLAGFAKARLGKALRLLLETYNERVRTREADQTLMIQIPANLPV
uniref:DUF4928 domain-containing protein n=1 Tax=Desulfobacca acetoxidans TaxID=60893 RepID=A0A7C3ZAK0_9BACT